MSEKYRFMKLKKVELEMAEEKLKIGRRKLVRNRKKEHFNKTIYDWNPTTTKAETF